MGILAWDVGTSSVKAAVLDRATGEPLGEVIKANYALQQPTIDQAVLAADDIWDAVLTTGRAAATQGNAVDGLGFSVLTPGLLLLDRHLNPLTPIITHLDRRSRPEAREMMAAHGNEFLQTNGNKPLPGGISGVAFRALIRCNPEMKTHIRHYLHVNSWLGMKMTGTMAFDPGNACFSGMLDTFGSPWQWSPRWCAYFGVEMSWLPAIRSGDQDLGPLLPAVAKRLGVAAGLPVKLGIPDTSSAALAGQLAAGEVLHVVGTTQVVATLANPPKPGPDRLTRPLGTGKHFIHVAHNPVGGVALDWLHQLCFRDQSTATFFGETLRAAHQRPTDVKFDPPFLGGDRLEIEPRFAAFAHLHLGTDRLDLASALLAAMAAGHDSALKSLGLPTSPSRVVLTGGGAEAIRALLPDYRDCAVELIDQASLRGVARLFTASGDPG